MIRTACRRLRDSPTCVVYLGGPSTDCLSARAARVPFIGLGIPGDVPLRRLPDLPVRVESGFLR